MLEFAVNEDIKSSWMALLLALLQRVARDPSILTLTSDEIKGTGQTLSRHKGCKACASCNGPSWAFKTESVATFWRMCCKPLTAFVKWTVLRFDLQSLKQTVMLCAGTNP